MFEFNGNLFSIQEVTATATELGLSLDEYLQKNPQVKRKQSEDFQNPAVQGATTGETQAPLTASELEGGLSVSQTLENRDTAKRKAIFKSM